MKQSSNYDLEYIRNQFPALSVQVNGQPAAYFDGPGGTQVPQRVIDAVVKYLVYCNANAGGSFLTSRNSDFVIREARSALADFLGAAPDEIAFGQNMTTMNFQLALALARNPGRRREIIITEIDHEANRGPWLALEERGYKVREVRIDPETCTIDMDDYRDKLSEKTFVAAVNYASNGVGTINDVADMIGLAHQAGAITVVDAVHYALHGPIDVKKLDADYLLCSAYKFFGPHSGCCTGRRNCFPPCPHTASGHSPTRSRTGLKQVLLTMKASPEPLKRWNLSPTWAGGLEAGRVKPAHPGKRTGPIGAGRSWPEWWQWNIMNNLWPKRCSTNWLQWNGSGFTVRPGVVPALRPFPSSLKE